MEVLQVRIAAVQRIALAVICQCQEFVTVVSGQCAAKRFGIFSCVATRTVFIDVVAQVNNRVQLLFFGGLGVDMEIAGRVIGARHNREADFTYIASR